MAKLFGLGREERLKSRKEIGQLFEKGKSFSAYPLRVTYLVYEDVEPGIRMGVTATKKGFKKAVDRNRVKRLVREAYRLQKLPLMEQVGANGKRLAVFFIYTGKEMESFENIKAAMQKALMQLQKRLP